MGTPAVSIMLALALALALLALACATVALWDRKRQRAARKTQCERPAPPQ